MIRPRPALAVLLLAVLAVGGVALPAAHLAAHGLEAAAEQAEHVRTAHADGGDHAQTPCAPAPGDVDCAVCTGLSAAEDLAEAGGPSPPVSAAAVSAYAEWIQSTAATGAGARAPPVG